MLASPVRLASISYDSAYIASVGFHDRLVKVWRRLSYESETVRFDFIYLSHPELVTNLQWRRPRHIDQTIDNVLYTFCADSVMRVWSGSDTHGQQLLQLWGQIDLNVSIQERPSETEKTSKSRWAFIVHGRDFSAATEHAVYESSRQGGEDAAALEHLIAVANRSPEICVIFDGTGRMSAWALENVGSKTQKATIFNVAHIRSDEFNFLAGIGAEARPYMQAYSYCNTGGSLHILFHFFDGRVEIFKANIARFFDPKPTAGRLVSRGIWSGHSAAIRKIVRNFSGQGVVSRTANGESIVWKHELGNKQVAISRKAMIQHDGHIHRMCVLRKGHFVVFLHHESISIWDCRKPVPTLLAQSKYDISGKPLCLLVLPGHSTADHTITHIATITSEKQGIVWEVRLPSHSAASAPPMTNGHRESSLQEYYRFDLPEAGDLEYVLPVDPAGSSPMISGFLDVFARDIAISYTKSGRIELWTARVDEERKRVEWLSTSSMETGVSEPSLVSGSTMRKAALVNSTRSSVTIWDIRGAQLEYAQDFEGQNTIQDLDWTSTPDSQSILAVGFPQRVLLLSQMRFDYLNKGPAWAAIREINIRDMTPHPIGDSTWLGDGHLVIGAGNQLFVYNRQFDVSSSLITSLRLPQKKDGKWDLFDVVQRLNGPLPVFHPQFLSQCILAGKITLVHRILMALNKTLKFWIEGEKIDDYLGLDLEEFYGGNEVSREMLAPLALHQLLEFFFLLTSYNSLRCLMARMRARI